MKMFNYLGDIKDGKLTSTRGMDQDEMCSLIDLMYDGYLTGTKTGKGYVALKLTAKGEEAVAFGRTPPADFLPKKRPWWEHPVVRWLGGTASTLLITYVVYRLGWN